MSTETPQTQSQSGTRTPPDATTDQSLASETAKEWFNQLLERDPRVCNNCFGRRADPGEAVTDAYEHSRSAGRNAMGGGASTSQTAEIFCNNCGAGYGADDIIDLDTIPPRTVDHADTDGVPPQAYEDDGTPVYETTRPSWFVRIAPAYGSPGDHRVERAENGFEIVAVDDDDSVADDPPEAAWEWPTNLSQRAARQVLGSVGRDWSEQQPLPKAGETPSLMRCVVNACARFDEQGFDVDAEKAKAMADRAKDRCPSQDREILAGVLYRSVADPDQVDAAATSTAAAD